MFFMARYLYSECTMAKSLQDTFKLIKPSIVRATFVRPFASWEAWFQGELLWLAASIGAQDHVNKYG
jgi:hypothetical protein